MSDADETELLKKYFQNPFEDYSPEAAYKVLEGNELGTNLAIVSNIETKWKKTLKKLGSVKFQDYSVYTGTAGIALLKLRKDPDNKANLENIKGLLQINSLKNNKISFLCGDAGPLALAAVVHFKSGDHVNCKKVVDRLISLHKSAITLTSDLANEYLYGRAGYLFALLYVNDNIHPPPVHKGIIRKIIDTMLTAGRNEAKSGKFQCPLMYQWHNSHYLGAAHGLSGILYLLLQAREYLTDNEINTVIIPTIDYLTTLRFSGGNFPSSVGRGSDKYVQWCHGAPGFLYMYSAAYKAFKKEAYLHSALECGEVIWKRGLLKKGYSLCHGVSGNAYCFLELYQTTQDRKHLYRAVKFAEWCFSPDKIHEECPPDRPLSLYEGIAGPMYLLLDIQKPLEAKFPGFTL